MVIGITDTRNKKFDSYVSWLRKVAKQGEVLKLSHESRTVKELKKCDGVILTGGGDIHPKFYGREGLLNTLDKKEIDVERDEHEFKIVREAVHLDLPILGICRGLQVFNVALGGSMIPDVVAGGFKNHAKSKEGKDRHHKVEIERGTMLHWIVESTKADVNTAHHQAVDTIAEDLRVSAKSQDGIVEALEWKDSGNRPFLQLVQWHPERMDDFVNPCSRNLLEHFVLAAASRSED
jgi:putative glutamine amidotransferase